MKNALKIALGAAAFLLVGQGCAPAAPALDLPTQPPGAMMDKGAEQKSATATMMEKEQQGEAAKSATGSMMQKEGEDVSAANKPGLKPYYVAYTAAQAEAALKEGRATVLYFWASWCPICRAEEPKLKGWIEDSGLPVAGFRVNYDTEKELKAKYGVTYQHTTVFLNARGEEVERFNGPVDEATFLAALKKSAE